MPPPSSFGAGIGTETTCVARRVTSWRLAAGSSAGWNRLCVVVPMSRVGSPSSVSDGGSARPAAGTPTGASSPPKLVPSSVMCQLIVKLLSMSAASNRSMEVSRMAWSPKRTSRTSTLPAPAGTSRTVARVLRSGMPAYALRSRNDSSPGASDVALPSMMASARPCWSAAVSASGGVFMASSAGARAASGLAGEPRLPIGAVTSNGSPRQVLAGSAWQSVPSVSAPNAGDAAPIAAVTASTPAARARCLKCAMPIPPICHPGAQSESRGPPPREPHPASDDASAAAAAHGRKVRKLVRDRALRHDRHARPRAPGVAFRARACRLSTLTSARGKLPDAVAQDRHRGAAGLHAVDLHLRGPHHEIDVRQGVVDADRHLVLGRDAVERPQQPRSERDVRRGVLVEQGVAEHEVHLAHARGAVDQRELAETPRAFVEGELHADELLALLGAHLDDLAAGEAHLEAVDDAALEGERPRAAHGALRAHAMGAREDLFRRHVRDVCAPGDGLAATRHPPRPRDETDLEVGPRSVVTHSAERPLGQRGGAGIELVEPLLPRRGRVRKVETHGVGDGRPEPVDVRLAEHLTRPALGRVRDDRPRDLAAVDRVEPGPLDIEHPLARETRGVDALVDVGVRAADDGDHSGPAVRRVREALDRPWRRVLESVIRPLGDERPTDERVAILDVDVARAGPVGVGDDGAHERRLVDLRLDEHVLALLHIDADAHDQAGVVLDVSHRPQASGSADRSDRGLRRRPRSAGFR